MPVRVVIAEDEWLIAAALSRQVQFHGYEVVGTVGTGTDAVALCRSQHPDVILMDVQMPEMDGIQATRILMETDPICVVIVTGKGKLEQESEQAGAMNYVTKPLLSNQIPLVVETARQRFERFTQIRATETDPSQSDPLASWIVIQRAVKKLAEESGSSEELAFQRLEQLATEQNADLLDAAQALLMNDAASA